MIQLLVVLVVLIVELRYWHERGSATGMCMEMDL